MYKETTSRKYRLRDIRFDLTTTTMLRLSLNRLISSRTIAKQAKLEKFSNVSKNTSHPIRKVNKSKLALVITLALGTSITSLIYQRDPPSEFLE